MDDITNEAGAPGETLADQRLRTRQTHLGNHADQRAEASRSDEDPYTEDDSGIVDEWFGQIAADDEAIAEDVAAEVDDEDEAEAAFEERRRQAHPPDPTATDGRRGGGARPRTK